MTTSLSVLRSRARTLARRGIAGGPTQLLRRGRLLAGMLLRGDRQLLRSLWEDDRPGAAARPDAVAQRFRNCAPLAVFRPWNSEP